MDEREYKLADGGTYALRFTGERIDFTMTDSTYAQAFSHLTIDEAFYLSCRLELYVKAARLLRQAADE